MQCDEDGRREQVLDEIVDYHKSDDALTKGEVDSNGKYQKNIRTTKG